MFSDIHSDDTVTRLNEFFLQNNLFNKFRMCIKPKELRVEIILLKSVCLVSLIRTHNIDSKCS